MAIEDVGVRLVAQSEAQFMAAMKNADGAVKGFGKTTASTSDQVQDSTKKMSTFGKGMEMLKPMVSGLIAMFAFDKVKDFFIGAVSSASNLNETLSKSTVVFGEFSSDIEAMGETAATSMGLSKNEAIAAAATYGNLFTSMNMSKDASANMSMNLVQLAADLASFNNIPVAEALEKIRAGLVGESEPLKSLGINLNEASLKQEALRLGLIKGNAPLDAAAKAQAAYSLMLKQSSNAQGDFARTADGAANQQRILEAQTKNLTAEIGKGLLPVWNSMLKALNEAITTFNTLRTRQETMDDVVKDHEKTMRKTAKTYDEYVAEMRRAIAVAQGFKNFQQYTQFMKAHNLTIQDVNENYGILSKEAFDAYRVVGDGVPKVERAVDATTRLANSQETYLKTIQADDTARQNNWNAAMKASADRANEAKTALAGITGAMILQMSTLEPMSDAWWDLAINLGVTTQAERTNYENMVALKQAYDSGKITVAQYEAGLKILGASIRGLPDQHVVNIEIMEQFSSNWLRDNLYTWGLGDHTFTYTSNFVGGQQNAPGGGPGGGPGGTSSKYTTSSMPPADLGLPPGYGRATGGSVWAGWPYMVGERGPEPFIPAMNGYILSKADAERIYASQVAASIPAAMVSAGPSSYSYSHANNYNLSVMTNQSPAVVQRSFAIMKLLAG